MKVLILDDRLVRHDIFKRNLIGHSITHTFTVEETIESLKNETFHWVFLDHDLDGKEMVPSGPGTGYEVAQWLADHPDRQPKTIVLHSCNKEGRNNMKALLPHAIECPGAWASVESEGWKVIKLQIIKTELT